MAIDSVPRTLPLEAADEGRLVARAQLGEQPAREELARRFRQPVYLLALQIVGNKDDALDIAQDAMLRFFQHLGRLRPERSMRPWLFTIVRNRARDLWRRRSARPSESLDGRTDLSSQLAHPALDPEQKIGRREREQQVWRAIAALSPSHRRSSFSATFTTWPIRKSLRFSRFRSAP